MPSSRRRGLVPIPRQLRRSRSVGAPIGSAVDHPDVGDWTPAADPLDSPAAAVTVDAEFALARQHVEALLRVLSSDDPGGAAWPATPDRLRSAVEATLGTDRGVGSVVVTRLPRALHSSESWHIRLGAVTPAGRDRLAEAVVEARLASSATIQGGPDVR